MSTCLTKLVWWALRRHPYLPKLPQRSPSQSKKPSSICPPSSKMRHPNCPRESNSRLWCSLQVTQLQQSTRAKEYVPGHRILATVRPTSIILCVRFALADIGWLSFHIVKRVCTHFTTFWPDGLECLFQEESFQGCNQRWLLVRHVPFFRTPGTGCEGIPMLIFHRVLSANFTSTNQSTVVPRNSRLWMTRPLTTITDCSYLPHAQNNSKQSSQKLLKNSTSEKLLTNPTTPADGMCGRQIRLACTTNEWSSLHAPSTHSL